MITHYGGSIHINNGTYLNIYLSEQPLIILDGGEDDYDDLLLNITYTNFTGVESQGNFAAVIGTVVNQVLIARFIFDVMICCKAWRVYLSSVSVLSSNSSNAVNKQGVVSLSTIGNAVVVVSNVIFDGIRLDLTTNGAFSLSGQAQSLSITNSTFRGIRTGNTGGALYLNVSYNTAYTIDTYIVNSV